jgi:macrodomain Ter protein organizer (MatP/YcbG family)
MNIKEEEQVTAIDWIVRKLRNDNHFCVDGIDNKTAEGLLWSYNVTQLNKLVNEKITPEYQKKLAISIRVSKSRNKKRMMTKQVTLEWEAHHYLSVLAKSEGVTLSQMLIRLTKEKAGELIANQAATDTL